MIIVMHVLSGLSISLIVLLITPSVFGQETVVPTWVKNNAGWWASEQIPDSAFIQGIQFLIKEGIMIIPFTEMAESSQSQEVPSWVKNTAGWWADDKISETEFVNAIKFLIIHGIIVVNNNSSCVDDLVEIFGDSNMSVKHTCDLHESSVHSELIPAIDSINYNSLGFRGQEFSEVKSSDTYRIFMLGGSTMIGSGASSDETTKPGILQKIFELNNPTTQKIQVINAAFFGANSTTELDLVKQKIIHYEPDLIIAFDGLNDLKGNFPVEKMKNNWRTMCEFGKKNNFDVIISLQPIPGFGNKKLTQQELVNSFTGEDHNGFQLITAQSTYDYMWREMSSLQDHCNVIDLRGIYDDISGPLYWDQGHVSDTANLITAEKFYENINELVFNNKSNEKKFHNVISKYNSPAITSYLLSKIGIDVDYAKIKKQDLLIRDKLDGNYFYLKNQLGGSEKILVGKDLSKDDLSKINLAGRDLSGANLSGQGPNNLKDLRNVDLTGTILRSANLSFTNLSGQDLSGKDLTGVNFHGANLENANLSHIITSRDVQLWNSIGEQCASPSPSLPYQINILYMSHKCAEEIIQNEKIRTDFSNTNLKGVTMNFSEYHYLHHIDFSGADLTGIELTNIGFRNCKFIGTKLNDSIMSSATFFYVDFINAELKNSQFTNTPFFQNVSFHSAEIINGYFQNPVFIDTNFSNTNLMDTIIDGPIMAGNSHSGCKNNQICD